MATVKKGQIKKPLNLRGFSHGETKSQAESYGVLFF